MPKFIGALALALLAYAVAPISASAHGNDPCPRPGPGTPVTPPPDLFSSNGVLNASFDYYTTVDGAGRTLFCFVTPDSLQSPTLHVRPGDRLILSVTNRNPPPPPGSPTEVVANPFDRCGAVTMTITSLNVHFHGTNTSPTCHSDQVVHTIINSGQTFRYSVEFPRNEPPGLYWYHPHVHGLSEAALQGGASGAIIVEGIENVQPAVAGLPERVLLIRDQIPDPSIPSCQTPGASLSSGVTVPSWDVSLNYVPVLCPGFAPAIVEMKPGEREFWRVADASADTIFDLQLQYDGAVQPLQVVALDGVPTGSQDGTMRGHLVTQSDILLAPAARAEFIVTGPSAKVKSATLLTLNVDTGPDGDNDPTRPLASVVAKASPPTLPIIPSPSRPVYHELFETLANAPVTAKRTLYFSEVLSDPTNPASPTNFFITVDGATPTLFDPNNPPAITTKQGAVEDWTIQNRSLENHEFHMHQIHFLLLERNGVPVPPEQSQYLDMIQVPYWDGTGPYPSVKVRMDFRGMDVGDFVYHCHILGHEDAGMMAIIRVLPRLNFFGAVADYH
jgi:FtsP/CotA-like multicopper oxidase with cupredoxin domain